MSALTGWLSSVAHHRRMSDVLRVGYSTRLTILALRIAAVLLAWAALLGLAALFYFAGVGMAGLWQWLWP